MKTRDFINKVMLLANNYEHLRAEENKKITLDMIEELTEKFRNEAIQDYKKECVIDPPNPMLSKEQKERILREFNEIKDRLQEAKKNFQEKLAAGKTLPPQKKKISTLEYAEGTMIYERRRGNTTRLIDAAIQIILSGNICIVQDHKKQGTSYLLNSILAEAIHKRLRNEHSWVYRNGSDIKVTKKQREITMELIYAPVEKTKTPFDGILGSFKSK